MMMMMIFMFSFTCSGAITKNFAVAKKLMANFILESFFSPLQVKKYMNEKMRTYLNIDNIGRYCPCKDCFHFED